MPIARRLLLLVLPVAVAGCGSANTPASSPTAASTATSTATSAAATPKPAAGGGAKKVSIKDFDYAPGKLQVAKGTNVTWTNADDANHTVTFDTGTKKSLGNQAKGKAASFTFTQAGTFAYHCDYHPNMHGTVVVR